jgi:AraC family transcriptional regulator
MEFVILSLEPTFMELIRGESSGRGEFEMALVHGVEDKFIQGVCLSLKREAEQGGTSGKLYSESLGTSLAMHLAQKYDVQNCSVPFAAPTPSAHFVRQAKEFIESRLQTDLSLLDIANAVGLSVFHFARQFKLCVGCSPHQYVIKRRVQRARHLLMRGQLSITAIAMESGFADQSHLTRQFKRYCGLTPKVFANQYGPRNKLS